MCFEQTYGQSTANVRYKDVVFREVVISLNSLYKDTLATGQKEAYSFDLYQPRGDTALARPLMIWLHGGGFRSGSKELEEIPLWCKMFAQRGYVCVALNYRLGTRKDLETRREFLLRSCALAVEDLYQAIAFFLQKSNAYKLDSDKIIVAGNSAGGFIALQAAFCRSGSLGDAQGKDTQVYGRDTVYQHKIAGVVNFWGAMFDLACLTTNNIPVVSVHGQADKTVLMTEKDSIFGSYAIHRRANELLLANRLKIYPGLHHQLQEAFNPNKVDEQTRDRWVEAGEVAALFLYEQLFK